MAFLEGRNSGPTRVKCSCVTCMISLLIENTFLTWALFKHSAFVIFVRHYFHRNSRREAQMICVTHALSLAHKLQNRHEVQMLFLILLISLSSSLEEYLPQDSVPPARFISERHTCEGKLRCIRTCMFAAHLQRTLYSGFFIYIPSFTRFCLVVASITSTCASPQIWRMTCLVDTSIDKSSVTCLRNMSTRKNYIDTLLMICFESSVLTY